MLSLSSELSDRDNIENESFLAGDQDIPAEPMIEASRMKEVDQSVLDGSDNVVVLNLEQTLRQDDEGLTGDQ